VAVVLVSNAAEADHSQRDVAYRYGTDILDDLPAHTVLITEGDDAAFVLDYLLRVEQMRPDVTLYNRVGRGTDMLTVTERRWPADQQSKRQRQREAALARGARPLFYLVSRRTPIAEYEFVPAGLLYRLLPSGDRRRAVALAETIEMDNAQQTNRLLDPWARKIQSNYWFMLGERMRVYGERQAALNAYERAAAIAFDSRTVQFNVGLMMLRLGELAKAEQHAEAALSIDPFQRQTLALLARIYRELGRSEDVQ
jgi:tetratricopeptide (TPR) repeat protein